MESLFPLAAKPLTPDAEQRWSAWLASECYDILLETLRFEAQKIALEAIRDSIRLAGQSEFSRTALADIIDRRDTSWQKVKWILNAIELLNAIRDGKIEPVKETTHSAAL